MQTHREAMLAGILALALAGCKRETGSRGSGAPGSVGAVGATPASAGQAAPARAPARVASVPQPAAAPTASDAGATGPQPEARASAPAGSSSAPPSSFADAGNNRCPEGMAFIPAARVKLGSDDIKDKKYWLEAEDNTWWPGLEEPIHTVNIAAFCMDITEVTVAAYRTCIEKGVCATPPKRNCTWGNPNHDDHPIDCVSWDQSEIYCKWLGKRLPTEDEWEYAARGTDGRRYPWGNEDPTYGSNPVYGPREGAIQFCRFAPDHDTCPVGQFPAYASPFGIEDMAGNVAEWTTTTGDCTAREGCLKIVRGRSTESARSASREEARPRGQNPFFGFRCAR